MKKQNNILVASLFLGGLIVGTSVQAFAIGETSPLSFHGTGARIYDLNAPGSTTSYAIAAENNSTTANSSSSATYSGSNVNASTAASEYSFNGSVSASGYTMPWRSGGYFYDELTFSPATPGMYSIDFVFDVNASAALFDASGGRADLSMTMSYWDGVRYSPLLDTTNLISISGNQGSAAVSGQYHLVMNGIDATAFTQPGESLYLPYTVGIWGDAVNGSITWNDISLFDVLVMDETGTVINSTGAYNLQSDSLMFSTVTSDVPLPAAFWLLGLGFAGLAGMRKKVKCIACAA